MAPAPDYKPTYDALGVFTARLNVEMYVCKGCGSLVWDRTAHDAWHVALKVKGTS